MQIDHSHPSLPSSPHPVLPPSLSRTQRTNFPTHRSSSRSSVSNPELRSHHHTYYPYPHHQVRMQPTGIDDPAQQLGQGLLQPATITDLDLRYHPWSALAPSYPYRSPLGTDGVVPTDSLTLEDTNHHPLLDPTATHHFPSMHLRAAPHPARRSPPNVNAMHHHRPSPILGSDPTQDPTTATTTTTTTGAAHTSAPSIPTMDPTASHEMYARIALAGAPGQLATTTAASLALSLDGSPSWSSAMTPMLSQQLDQLYHYQAARLGPPPRPGSSPVPNSSHSTTGHPPQQRDPPSPASAPAARSAPPAHRYSQELRRQQEEQMRRAQAQLHHQQQQAAYVERERRRSEEEQFLLQFSENYRQPSAGGSSSAGSARPSPPHLHAQQQQQQVQEAPPRSHAQQFFAGALQAYAAPQAGLAQQQHLPLDMDGPYQGHRAYPLVDGPLHPLGLPAESPLE